ncbi:MAG: plasmid mobilization protein [Acidiferrobacteraceae bacterium]
MERLHRRRVIKVYVDEADYQQIADNAAKANRFLSDYLRRIALGHRVRSVVDAQMVGELRRLGALLKHRYPQAAYWTPEEKRRYWAGYEQLMALATRLEELIVDKGPGTHRPA